MQSASKKQKFQLLLGCADRTAYISRPPSDFGSQKESDFSEWLQSHTHYGEAAISNSRTNTRIRYGISAHVSDGYRQQHCF